MSYLSLIFARKREPSLEAAEKIAYALRMGLEEFLIGLRGHVVRVGSKEINRGTLYRRVKRRVA